MNKQSAHRNKSRLASAFAGLKTLSGRHRQPRPDAFTFTDLLVVIALVSLAATVILPATARSRNSNAVAQCMNNLNQLSIAWRLYSADNQGRLVSTYPGVSTPNPSAWCTGNAGNVLQPGGTDTSGSYGYSTTDPTGIKNGKIWPYIKQLGVYKCPADERTAKVNGQIKPILRSVSMNSYLNGVAFPSPITSTFCAIYKRVAVSSAVKNFHIRRRRSCKYQRRNAAHRHEWIAGIS
jgi:type II secretory pathway pseudopilin PulG